MKIKIVIKEIDFLPFIAHGWGNGYIILDKNHPWYGVPYDEIEMEEEIHGGLTYGRIITDSQLKLFNLPKTNLGKYMIGFDTAHFGDTLENWSESRVLEETKRLAKMAENAAKLKK